MLCTAALNPSLPCYDLLLLLQLPAGVRLGQVGWLDRQSENDCLTTTACCYCHLQAGVSLGQVDRLDLQNENERDAVFCIARVKIV